MEAWYQESKPHKFGLLSLLFWPQGTMPKLYKNRDYFKISIASIFVIVHNDLVILQYVNIAFANSSPEAA